MTSLRALIRLFVFAPKLKVKKNPLLRNNDMPAQEGKLMLYFAPKEVVFSHRNITCIGNKT